MSTTCGFGQTADLRANTLCVRGKIVLDKNRNIFANVIHGKTMCPNTVQTPKITEKLLNHGVILDKFLPMNQPGIGRIELNANNNPDTYKLNAGSSIIFNQEDDWSKTFETTGFGPEYILQTDIASGNVNAYTVPAVSDYLNPCLAEITSVYVECNLHLTGTTSPFITNNEKIQGSVQLLKNGSVVSQTYETYLVETTGLFSEQIISVYNLHDIVKCVPGDVLNVKFKNLSATNEIGLINYTSGFTISPETTGLSYVTFKTLGFGTGVEV